MGSHAGTAMIWNRFLRMCSLWSLSWSWSWSWSSQASAVGWGLSVWMYIGDATRFFFGGYARSNNHPTTRQPSDPPVDDPLLQVLLHHLRVRQPRHRARPEAQVHVLFILLQVCIIIIRKVPPNLSCPRIVEYWGVCIISVVLETAQPTNRVYICIYRAHRPIALALEPTQTK